MKSQKIIFFIFTILWFSSAFALKLEFVAEAIIPHKMEFQKSIVGGLSGLYWDATENKLYSNCDDRGKNGEPRFYQLEMKLTPFEVKPEKVIFLSVNPTELSHDKTKVSAKSFSQVLDLEGISRAPWGDFLFASEGDANHIPRIGPQIFSVKPDGTIMKDFDVPKDFMPELTGKQSKGIQNNKAFEGLAANPNGKEWIAATEESLVQDPTNYVRFLQYTMPDPFVLKPGKEWHYPITSDSAVSEITYLDETHLLVLERGFVVSTSGIKTKLQIYVTDLSEMKKKTLVLDILKVKGQEFFENYEGMTIGPRFPDGKRSLIVVSDDNFMRNQATKFLLFKISE